MTVANNLAEETALYQHRYQRHQYPGLTSTYIASTYIINSTAESFKDELNNNLYDFMDNKLSCADCLNLNAICEEFVSIMKQTTNFHPLMKPASCKQKKLLKRLWLSKAMMISTKKQKMYKTHFLSNNESLITSYKHYAPKLNKIKYSAKKTFCGKKFDKNKNNPYKTWQAIESLLPNNKGLCLLSIKLWWMIIKYVRLLQLPIMLLTTLLMLLISLLKHMLTKVNNFFSSF